MSFPKKYQIETFLQQNVSNRGGDGDIGGCYGHHVGGGGGDSRSDGGGVGGGGNGADGGDAASGDDGD